MTWTSNKGFILTVLFLLGLGLVQVYSSSFIFAIESLGDGQYFFHRQLLFTILAVCTIFVIYKIPTQYLKGFGLLMWAAGVIGLILTFVPEFAIKAGGASRWVKLPLGQRFEPAEILKYSIPFVAAIFLTSPMKGLGKWKWPVFALALGPVFVMFLKQPDFGSFVICGLIVLIMAFCFGLKLRYLVLSSMATVPAFYFFVVRVPYRWARIVTYLDPWTDPSDKGFQIIQSMLSYYSGGVWGVGLGQGQGKLFFLPEAHTDFTLSVLGEELGFLGFALVMFLFGFIIYRGFQIALDAKNTYLKALAIGIVSAFTLSVLINCGVTLGMLPTKGLSMPFMSYGGSSLLSTCIGLGILLNIDRLNQKQKFHKNFRGYNI